LLLGVKMTLEQRDRVLILPIESGKEFFGAILSVFETFVYVFHFSLSNTKSSSVVGYLQADQTISSMRRPTM